MSTLDPALVSSLLQNANMVPANIQENYLFVASACLYYYEYVLTLPAEVRLIWRCPRNLSTYFYLAIRYGFFLQVTVTLMCVQSATDEGSRLTVDGCVRLEGFMVILNIINFATISAFVATRLFAMYARNWYLGACIFILGVLSPSSITQATIFAFPIIVAPWPLYRCLSVQVGSQSSLWSELAFRYGPIALSVTNMVYETLCFGLTAAKTFGLYREQRRLRISTTLPSLLLRNGVFYFGVLVVLSLLNIVAALNTKNLPGFWPTNTDVARVIVPIFTTRFIIQLRRMSQGSVDIVLPDFDSIKFAGPPEGTSLEPISQENIYSADRGGSTSRGGCIE